MAVAILVLSSIKNHCHGYCVKPNTVTYHSINENTLVLINKCTIALS